MYDSRVELRLVTRIFMTRHIATRRWVVDSSDAALEVTAGAKAAVPGVPVPAVSAAGPNGTPPPSGTAASAVGAPAGGTAQAGTQWSNETEIGLTGVFQRPVVFGYRSIRHLLKRSEHSTENAEDRCTPKPVCVLGPELHADKPLPKIEPITPGFFDKEIQAGAWWNACLSC